jgi:hypothetical protein
MKKLRVENTKWYEVPGSGYEVYNNAHYALGTSYLEPIKN